MFPKTLTSDLQLLGSIGLPSDGQGYATFKGVERLEALYRPTQELVSVIKFFKLPSSSPGVRALLEENSDYFLSLVHPNISYI